jgi:hypothetical protein
MDQALSPAWKSAKPLTADHINSAGGISKDRKEFREFLDQLQAAVGAAICNLGPVQISCRIASVNTVSKAWEEPSENLHWFASREKQIHLWLLGDRNFDRLLCELAYGGSAKGTLRAGADTPPTKIEQRLTARILKQISAGIAQVLDAASGCGFARVDTVDPEALEQFANPQRMVETKFSIEVFQNTCEITAYFLTDEIKEALLENPNSAHEITPYDSVRKCGFELLSLLPPDEISLAEILSIRPGSQLTFSFTVDCPIMIVCGDAVIFEGDCDLSGDNINIHLSSCSGNENHSESANSTAEVGGVH